MPLRLTNVNTEVNTVLGLPTPYRRQEFLNFPLSRTFTISNFFGGPVGVRDSGNPLFFEKLLRAAASELRLFDIFNPLTQNKII